MYESRPIKTITNYVGIPKEKPYKNGVPLTGECLTKLKKKYQ